MEKPKQGTVHLSALVYGFLNLGLFLAGGWAFLLRRDTRGLCR